MITGILLAVARIAGETAPLLFTALNNQFWSSNMNAPMANLPVVIFQFALSPYDDWQRLAWGGALLITVDDPAAQHRRPHARRGDVNKGSWAWPPAARRCARTSRGAPRPSGETAKVSIRDLDFFYGDFHALKGINLPLHERQVTAFIGPSGCGKSTLLRILNRIYDLYPGQRATGEVLLDGENILDRRAGPQPAARPRRHGVPEAHAVPDVDLRQHRLRRAALRAPVQGRRWTSRVEELAAPRGALGRGEGQAAPERPRPLGRPAAAPVHRARDRRAARGASCSTSRPRRSTRSRPPRSRS